MTDRIQELNVSCGGCADNEEGTVSVGLYSSDGLIHDDAVVFRISFMTRCRISDAVYDRMILQFANFVNAQINEQKITTSNTPEMEALRVGAGSYMCILASSSCSLACKKRVTIGHVNTSAGFIDYMIRKYKDWSWVVRGIHTNSPPFFTQAKLNEEMKAYLKL